VDWRAGAERQFLFRLSCLKEALGDLIEGFYKL
jgi:hypothetical protein